MEDGGIAAFVDEVVSLPERFATSDAAVALRCQAAAAAVYDYAKQREPAAFDSLDELLVEGFDLGQVWEQVQLHNAPLLRHVAKSVVRLGRAADAEAAARAARAGGGGGGSGRRRRRKRSGADDGGPVSEGATSDVGGGAGSGEIESDSDGEADGNGDGDGDDLDSGGEGGEGGGGAPSDAQSSISKQFQRDGFFDFDDMERFVQRAEDGEEDERQAERAVLLHRSSGNDDGDLVDDTTGASSEEGGDSDQERDGEAGAQYADFFGGAPELAGSGEDDEEGQVADGDGVEDGDGDLAEDGDSDASEAESDPDSADGDSAAFVPAARFDGARANYVFKSGQAGLGYYLEGADIGARQQKVHFDEKARAQLVASEDSGTDKGDGVASREARSTKLDKRIREYEEQNIGDKPWQLSGEVQGKGRPSNSLLQENLEFEQATRPNPVITQQATESLEEMIKRRILDDAFDDVVTRKPLEARGVKPAEKVSDEKSQAGLGDIYEDQYMQQAVGVEKDDEISKIKCEISEAFKVLCQKLDALSNFGFAPKPLPAEISSRPNISSIQMEEANPSAVSNAAMLAPQEIFGKPVERKRSRSDRKRDKAKRKRRREAEIKLAERSGQAALGNKYATTRALEQIRGERSVKTGDVVDSAEFATSRAFFEKLEKSTEK